ncbi:MAG: OadG family protein [Clostridia bacterium]|nr:OadG family protein [Clostridia bacterium]
METLIFGLTVTGIGVAIVFAGLIVLIGLIKLVNIATGGSGKPKKEKKAAAPAKAPAPAPAAPAQDEQVMAVIAAAVAAQDEELIAVISAAVAAMMDDGAAFTVRRIRRVTNASAWQKAGREEQVYSRF